MTDIDDPVVRLTCAGDRAVVTAAGEFDRDSNSRLRDVFRQAHRHGCRHIVVDVQLVTFIDVSTVRLLLTCRQDALERQGTVRVRHARGATARVLRLTGAAEVLCGPEVRAPGVAMEHAHRLVLDAAEVLARSTEITQRNRLLRGGRQPSE
ncbi:anti-anti-sigma factor [Actinoplanes octamycinicus]|uniref:Anti-anti-sigma factor n=1 Tax=Actinoplanes octamycinicus TaxID=135948 RepID=A0A7W7MAB9_9ACTN|nr:STAS domain-containing protein [Actinoplanes octamycinicus]MBB4742680.1 anti-anti-sigma factor [Actinoplanes octamycinicus]GIE62983.1 hypothetical protein Aoc01nite_83850 [Actinoplanes octamycinicus]